MCWLLFYRIMGLAWSGFANLRREKAFSKVQNWLWGIDRGCSCSYHWSTTLMPGVQEIAIRLNQQAGVIVHFWIIW